MYGSLCSFFNIEDEIAIRNITVDYFSINCIKNGLSFFNFEIGFKYVELRFG